MYYESNKKQVLEHSFSFENESEFHVAWRYFDEFNLKKREDKPRSLCVIVNPIGGKRSAPIFYRTILKPMLDFEGLDYQMFETDSADYVKTFVQDLKVEEMPFTEFVVIGGDGLFSQLLNSFGKHPNKEQLLKFPIGLMPGGSSNSLCWCLGGKDPYTAAIQIVRGHIMKGNMFTATLKDDEKTQSVLATAMTFGFPSDMVINSEKLRPIFGQYRYFVLGVKSFLCSIKLPVYRSNVKYSIEDLGVQEELKETVTHSEISEQGDESFTRKAPVMKTEEDKLQTADSLKEVPRQTKKITNKYQTLEEKDEQDGVWKNVNVEDYLFYCIVAHEALNSIETQSAMPFTRANDSHLHMMSMKKSTKIDTIKYMCKLNKGMHYKHRNITAYAGSEYRIKFPQKTTLWLDGEVYESQDVTLKFCRGALNLMGTVAPYTKDIVKFRQTINKSD